MNIMSTIEKFRPVANAALPNTLKVIDKTWKQIKFIWKLWGITALIFKLSYIAYLIFALATELGNLYVNIGFLVFSVAYLVFDQTTRAYESPNAKKKTRAIKKWFRYAKIGADVVKLSMAVYGVCISWTSPSVVGVVLAVFSALVFVFDVLFEIIYTIIVSRYKQLCDAFNEDCQSLKSVSGIISGTAGAVKAVAKPHIDAAINRVSNVGNFFSGKKDKKEKDSKSKNQGSRLGGVKTKIVKLRDMIASIHSQKDQESVGKLPDKQNEHGSSNEPE